MTPDTLVPRRPFQFSLRTLLFLFIPVAVIAAFASWILRPPAIKVQIEAEQCSLSRYDDHTGQLPLPMCGEVRVTNMSESTVWVLGYPGAPTYVVQQLVDGKWSYCISSVNVGSAGTLPKRWTAIHGMESIAISAGAISEKTTEVRVGVPCTTERLWPTSMHWIISRTWKVVKRGGDYFFEVKNGTDQEEQVLPLVWAKGPTQPPSFPPPEPK